MAKIYILLPVHNRKDITRCFIECLKAQTFTDFHLILIDDGSQDGTSSMVQEYIPSTTVLSGNGNWWWAGSMQCGLNWLKAMRINDDALILFINDDVIFDIDYLKLAAKLMAQKKGVLMLSKHGDLKKGEIVESGIYADLKRLVFKVADTAKDINCLSTRGLFIYWQDVKKVGGFHPIILPHYLSDYEFTIRAYRKGLKCETSDNLIIEPNSTTTGYHKVNDKNLWAFLKQYFSKKSPSNPIYFTSFIFLTCKPNWVVINLIRVWGRAFREVTNSIISTCKSCMHQ